MASSFVPHCRVEPWDALSFVTEGAAGYCGTMLRAAIFIALVLPAAAQSALPTEDAAARVDWIDPHSDARALTNLCDRDMYVTRAVASQFKMLLLFRTNELINAYTAFKGPRACMMALLRYGPAGTVQAGLVAEGLK